MSVKKRPNGKWRARFRDETGREHARHFDTQREARAWEALKRSQVARGEHVPSPIGRLTLAEYAADHYLPTRAWAVSSVEGFERTLAACPMKDMPLSKVTRADGERWLAEMLRTRARNTTRTRFASIRAMLDTAAASRAVTHNPLAGIPLPSAGNPAVDREDIPTATHIGAMLHYARTDDQRALIQLMALCGLRIGEALAMQPRAVDFSRGRILVRRQVSRSRDSIVRVSPPKYGSTRDVPAPPALLDLLADMIETRCAKDDDWIFPGRVPGAPVTASAIGNQIRLLGAHAGLATHPHALRHFFASALIEEDLSVVEVARLMGHKNVSTTLDVYAHLWHDAATQQERASLAVAAGVLAELSGLGESARSAS